MPNRLKALLAVVPLLAAGLVVVSATAAGATGCSSPVKYSPSSNTISLVSNQAYRLTDIVAACPAAPLSEVDPATQTWELRGDLVLQNGATLVLHGSRAASPGDVDTLRLRSLASNAPTEVTQLTAKYGTIDADSVHVTSWDDAAGAPDTNTSVPSGAPSGSRGRAFVRALSYLAPDGVTPLTSTMTIRNSEFDHLGWYASEMYGVAFKAEGCDHLHLSVCAMLHVYGEESNSHFHDNYMGSYTWGAYGVHFTNNEYDHDTMYGLDPHDVSSNLVIDHDHFDYNGDHGVICAQQCDNLTITNNESDHNGLVPWTGPNPDNTSESHQVHGIMLYRGITNTVVSGNYVHDQPNGAGIAVFDSAGDTVTGNQLVGNKDGIHLSVGSASNTISNNTVQSSGQYALYFYKGSDAAASSTPNGHPTANLVAGNTFASTGSNAVKLNEADGNVFRGNTVTGSGGSLYLYASAGTVFDGNTLDVGQKTSVGGTSSEPASLQVVAPSAPTLVSLDSTSTADVTSGTGTLFAVAAGVGTATAPGSSDLHLTSSLLKTTGTVTVTPQPVTVQPESGSAVSTAKTTGTGASATTGISSTAAAGTALDITVAGLVAGAPYTVTRAGAVVATTAADSNGVIRFTDTPPTGAAILDTVAAS